MARKLTPKIHRRIKAETSKELLDKLSENGVSPIEVMINSMRNLYSQYEECLEQGELTNHENTKESIMRYGKDCLRQACEIAKDVAPYFHPRLQAITHAGDEDKAPIQMELTTVADLRKFLRGGEKDETNNGT